MQLRTYTHTGMLSPPSPRQDIFRLVASTPGPAPVATPTGLPLTSNQYAQHLTNVSKQATEQLLQGEVRTTSHNTNIGMSLSPRFCIDQGPLSSSFGVWSRELFESVRGNNRGLVR